MFKSLKGMLGKRDSKRILINSPIEGEAVSLKDVNDPTFSEEIIGTGVAIKPHVGRVVSPVNGVITVMLHTKHAVALISDDAVEILIHIGLDTVKLEGEYFKTYVKAGDKVSIGDLLIEFDIEKIKEAGYDTICPIVICTTTDFSKVKSDIRGNVKELDLLLEIQK